MVPWLFLVLACGQLVESDDFPKALQERATAATVRIVNRSQRLEGSGVVIGRKDKSIYVLTAAHFLDRRIAWKSPPSRRTRIHGRLRSTPRPRSSRAQRTCAIWL